MAATDPPATATAKADQSQSLTGLFWEILLLPLDISLVKIMPEIGHLAPIILTAGSLFFATITLNYPLAMLGLSSLEASAIYKFISIIAGYAETPFTADSEEKSANCSSFFQTLTSSRFRFLVGKGIKSTFPNYPLFFITYMSAYCIESMRYFNTESAALGSQYSNRIYLAILSAAMFVILYALYLLIYGCDSLLNLFCSTILGALIGFLLCYQNATLFGKTSVDLLFIPSIVKRSGMDYICVSSS